MLEEKMSYDELATDRDRMKTARDSYMLSNANLKVENHNLKNRRWVGLTDEQIAEMMMQTWGCASIAPRHAPAFARAIEAKLKEKNT